jgi:hypothetical protein
MLTTHLDYLAHDFSFSVHLLSELWWRRGYWLGYLLRLNLRGTAGAYRLPFVPLEFLCNGQTEKRPPVKLKESHAAHWALGIAQSPFDIEPKLLCEGGRLQTASHTILRLEIIDFLNSCLLSSVNASPTSPIVQEI